MSSPFKFSDFSSYEGFLKRKDGYISTEGAVFTTLNSRKPFDTDWKKEVSKQMLKDKSTLSIQLSFKLSGQINYNGTKVKVGEFTGMVVKVGTKEVKPKFAK
jgi:hypothetical protein